MIKHLRDAAVTTVSESTSAIKIDTSAIPDEVRDDLAAATLDLICGILREPGGREKINAKIKQKRLVITATVEKEQCTT